MICKTIIYLIFLLGTIAESLTILTRLLWPPMPPCLWDQSVRHGLNAGLPLVVFPSSPSPPLEPHWHKRQGDTSTAQLNKC